MPLVVNEVLDFLGSGLVGIVVSAAEPGVAIAYGIFVVYVAAYSFYFFRPGHALLQAAVAGAAYHELRTPLHVIAGSAELLAARHRELEREDVRSLLASQLRNTERLVRLVEDLDALHQLGHGAMSPATVPVPLRELVTEAVAEAGIGTHPVTVEASDRTVSLDPGFARRILRVALPVSAPVAVGTDLTDPAPARG